jgi:hypothetical protein
MKATDLWNLLVQSGIFAVLLGLVVSGIKYGKTYLDAKTAETTAKIKDANVKSAINTAEDCVTTVVSELAQTTVEALKAQSADGKLTAEDAESIKATALAKSQSLMSDDVICTLNTVFGNAETWVGSKIEAAVKASKLSIGTSAVKTVASNIIDVVKGSTVADIKDVAEKITTMSGAAPGADTTDAAQTATV